VFAFPSTREGFPGAVLEAMAAGLPVVAYDLPAFQGWLVEGEHGFLVPINDHRQMADRLLKLLQNDSLRREISNRNIEYARRFTWERAADQEENTLISVLARWCRNRQ
jgi:glycosyltransferase involved in cell wall biosynthesis